MHNSVGLSSVLQSWSQIGRSLLRLALILPLSATFMPAGAEENAVVDALQARMEELQFSGDLEIAGAQIAARRILPTMYAIQEFRPLWTDEARVSELLALLDTAPQHGLRLEDYYVTEVRSQISEAWITGWPLDRADKDILLTEAFIRFVYHQLFGKVNPVEFDASINFVRTFLDRRESVLAIPEIVNSEEPLQAQLDAAIHRGPIYRTFQRHLAWHRRIATTGGWLTIPDGDVLRKGETGPRVVALRARLSATADLSLGSDTTSPLFDDHLEAALIRFQTRHALSADGIMGKQSLAALNVPVETRIDQLRLSLERLRWVRGERAKRFVAVNIAGFRAFFLVDDDVVWTSRVMVGTPYRKTPIFRGSMQYLEFNPTWTVPPIVVKEDLLPAIQRDPGYLSARNMTVIDRDGHQVDPDVINWDAYSQGIPYTIRQESGPGNALGEIKFIFPNKHFVYMHDTPSQRLFDRPQRAFSSGCIRIEKPFDLAELVLNDPERWNRQTFRAIRDDGRTRRISTPDRIPVLILYLTASVEQDGQPRFLNDVYERDARLLEILNGPVHIELPEW